MEQKLGEEHVLVAVAAVAVRWQQRSVQVADDVGKGADRAHGALIELAYIVQKRADGELVYRG